MGIFNLFKRKKITTETENMISEYNSFIATVKEQPLEIEKEITSLELKIFNEIKEENMEQIFQNETSDNDYSKSLLYDPRMELPNYKHPILTSNKTKIDINAEQIIKDSRIIEILNSFGINIQSISANVGAIITVFEIVPKPGLKITTLQRLEDDIACSLLASKISIIPIYERGCIGIVVPNKDPEILSIGSIINTNSFNELQYELPVAIGKTITNDEFAFDLCKMPHLLVSGATGQGKSVALNTMIMSLLYKKHPAELKLVLIDPRKLEMNAYASIQNHFIAKLPTISSTVVSNIRDTVDTMIAIAREMHNRYNLLVESNTRTIKEYNEKFIIRKLNPNDGHKYLPYIVVIVDEISDFITCGDDNIISTLEELTSKAHIVGIHLIISTRRPSAKIIPNSIKANLLARLSFKVASSGESHFILEEKGAEHLAGSGDALFSYEGKITRLQVAFAEAKDIDNLVSYIGAQEGYSSAYYFSEEIDKYIDNDDIYSSNINDLFNEAARLVVEHQHGSTSLIQRKLKLGYNQAGKLIDQLEYVGIIGPFEGSKSREVLIKNEEQLNQILASLK